MNKAVELLIKWDTFNQQFPEASLQDFCRYELAFSSEVKNETDSAAVLLRIMGRIMSAFGFYHRSAMTQIKMPSSESFFFLNGLAHLGEVKKTDLINYLFFEYTTGMEAINKLIKNGLVKEKQDLDDKRAKLLSLTAEGKKELKEGYKQSSKVSEVIFKDVNPDVIHLCIHLLKQIEEKHSKLVVEMKNESFEEIYKKIIH